MGDILQFNGITTNDIPIRTMLDKTNTDNLSRLFLIGETKDGEIYFAGSDADRSAAVYLLMKVVHDIYAGAYG